MSSLLRVLQLVQKPQRRGAEIFASQLSEEMRGQGHEVRMAYLYPSPPPDLFRPDRGDVQLGGDESSRAERLIGLDPRLGSRVVRLIRDFRPEIVQVNGGRAVKYGAFARRLLPGWSLVYRNIGMPAAWVPGLRRKVFYRGVMRQVDGVVAVSGRGLAALQTLYAYRVPATVIHNGLDPASLVAEHGRGETREMLETPDGSPVILYLGSLSAEKRVDRLLQVHREVLRRVPSAVLWIAGGGPLRPSLEEQAREMGIAPSVRWLGIRSEIGSLYGAADLLALTSDTEGVPGVILEAGCAGLPVVTADVGGIAECVAHGVTGYLVPHERVEEYAERIVALIADPGLRRAMGSRARASVLERFSMRRIASEYLAFYALVRGASGRGGTRGDP